VRFPAVSVTNSRFYRIRHRTWKNPEEPGTRFCRTWYRIWKNLEFQVLPDSIPDSSRFFGQQEATTPTTLNNTNDTDNDDNNNNNNNNNNSCEQFKRLL